MNGATEETTIKLHTAKFVLKRFLTNNDPDFEPSYDSLISMIGEAQISLLVGMILSNHIDTVLTMIDDDANRLLDQPKTMENQRKAYDLLHAAQDLRNAYQSDTEEEIDNDQD